MKLKAVKNVLKIKENKHMITASEALKRSKAYKPPSLEDKIGKQLLEAIEQRINYAISIGNTCCELTNINDAGFISKSMKQDVLLSYEKQTLLKEYFKGLGYTIGGDCQFLSWE